MNRTQVASLKCDISSKFGTLLNFVKEYDLPLYQVYRCFKLPQTEDKTQKLKTLREMIDTDTSPPPLSRTKIKKLIRQGYGSVYQFCKIEGYNYNHVNRFLSGVVLKLDITIMDFLRKMSERLDSNLSES